MSETDREKALERLLDRVLREQPLQRAPSTLAARVFAEIERREALTWWRSGFSAWPAPARMAFALTSLALVAFAIELPAWLLDTIDPQLPMPIGVSRGFTLWQALTTIGSAIANSIPAQWVYAILGSIAMLYAICFGAGAAAYRTWAEAANRMS
jgi:hypothetical protein